ncbi:hypothetical protein J3F84DRAFT_312623 [Trichoderma pleuroticola]
MEVSAVVNLQKMIMSRNLCFIIVGGITRPLTPDYDSSSLVRKLKEWFPKCKVVASQSLRLLQHSPQAPK